MQEQNSNSHKNFRTHFLLKFTEELIRNTSSYRSAFIEMNVKKIVHEKKEIGKAREERAKEAMNVVRKETQNIIKEKTGR